MAIGTEAKYIADEAIKLGMEKSSVFTFNNNEEACEFIKKNLTIEDMAILVKASRGMKLEEVVEFIKDIIK